MPHHPDETPDPDAPATGSRVGSARLALAVGVGGAVGAALRYEVGVALPSPSSGFPVATFLANVSGSLVLGALLTLVIERWPPSTYLRPFAATGVVGAYTTWSSFVVEADLLTKDGHPATALGYVVASLAAGLAAAWVGIAGARRLGVG